MFLFRVCVCLLSVSLFSFCVQSILSSNGCSIRLDSPHWCASVLRGEWKVFHLLPTAGSVRIVPFPHLWVAGKANQRYVNILSGNKRLTHTHTRERQREEREIHVHCAHFYMLIFFKTISVTFFLYIHCILVFIHIFLSLSCVDSTGWTSFQLKLETKQNNRFENVFFTEEASYTAVANRYNYPFHLF